MILFLFPPVRENRRFFDPKVEVRFLDFVKRRGGGDYQTCSNFRDTTPLLIKVYNNVIHNKLREKGYKKGRL